MLFRSDTRQIADLLEVLKNSPSKSVHTERYETLSKALNDALTQAIKNSQNQPLFSLSDKLGKVEQLTTSKDLGGFKMALKELVEEIKNPLTPIPKDVNSLTLRRFEILKTQIIQTAQELEPILQSKEIPELQTLVRTKELNFNIQTLNFSTQPPLSTNSLSPNLDIGDKLKLAINQIKTSIALLAPRSAKISSSLANAQSAINSLAKLEVNEPNLTDLKQTVMQMRDTSQNRELITTCSKIISQIEMNQLYSLTSNSIYTFSPYMWDGVKKGNIKLKTENEKSYCQIRLDFERFKRVNVLLGLFEQKYLHVNFSFESKNLENIAVENLSELKKLMVDAGILLSSVSIVPFADSNFFENDNLKDEFGIDIRT